MDVSGINLDEKSFSIVRDILKRNLTGKDVKAYIFGSRANGKNRKYSDVDIALKAQKDIEFSTMAKLRCEFDDSNLDYIVDIVDLNDADESFVKHIENDLIEFSF
jgi:predicted nucleotidyltransferase